MVLLITTVIEGLVLLMITTVIEGFKLAVFFLKGDTV